MNFIRSVSTKHALCFSSQNKMLFVEYYFDSQKNIKISKTNMDELTPFLTHIYKLETDLKNAQLVEDCCFSCFSKDKPSERQCAKCKTHPSFFSKQRRCPNCYMFLCSNCFEYATNNLKNYQDFIIYYQSQTFRK
jgi:hypothetical protein